jgi:nucleoside-diphosphate-sugar epimerase
MQIKTLVTGYRGFIGNKVFNKLIEMNCDVIGIDLKDGENIANCLPDEDFDYVFHLAALPSVAYSIQHPSYTMRHRYFNVYSEDQKYGGAYSTAISAWMEMIKQNKPLRIDGDGSQTRDFIHVDDIISANIFCMLEKQNFKGKTLNVGTGISVSLNYIKKHIDSKYQVSWNRASERIGDIKFSKADISELKKLGWKPKITIDEGLNRCFNRSNK